MRKYFYILLLIPLMCSSQIEFRTKTVKIGKKLRIKRVDAIAPNIFLTGNSLVEIVEGNSFTEPGYTATDNRDGDITGSVVVGGDTVDPNTVGTYVITYNVSDAAGNAATEVTRTVNVISSAAANTLIDDDFSTQDANWVLINGSTISGGVLTVNATGSVGSNSANWSAGWNHLLNTQYYRTRRFRFTFTARQTNGSGTFQIGQDNNVAFEGNLTSSFATYTAEVNGNASNAENDINMGGRTSGDVFEVTDFKMEIIGGTTNPNVPSKPANVVFFTDFESATYPYDPQWGDNGVPEDNLNEWEVDNGLPVYETPGRNGTGRAMLLDERYFDAVTNRQNRNEVGKDELMSFDELWNGFSFKVNDTLPDTRLLMQMRNLAAGGSNTVNSITLRQETTGGANAVYFSICTDPTRVDQTEATLGGWNGAGTGTTRVDASYNTTGWNDVVIHYKAGFGAGYSGPENGPQHPGTAGQTLTDLNEQAGYDMATDGFIEIWLNGVKIVDHVGTTIFRYQKTGHQIRFGMTPKIGPYWGTAFINETDTAQGSVSYDNYIVWLGPGGTFSDVDPSN